MAGKERQKVCLPSSITDLVAGSATVLSGNGKKGKFIEQTLNVGQEASAPEKKRGTTRGGGATRGGQMEALLDGRLQRTRGNTKTSWGRQKA
jgi:hypothetical protein